MPIVGYALNAAWYLSYSELVSPHFVLSYSCFRSLIQSVGLCLPRKNPPHLPACPFFPFSLFIRTAQLLGSPQVVSEHLHHQHHHCHSH